MIVKSIPALLLFCLLAAGCDDRGSVSFTAPQPSGVGNLNRFPPKLQGSYISSDKASTLNISEEAITRTYDFDLKIHKDSLHENYKLLGDTLIHPSGERELVVRKGDTLIQHIYGKDTLFLLGDKGILKSFKGYLFLNTLHDSASWQVQRIALQRGVLTVGYISDSADIARLREISETAADTNSYRFNLSRKQFKHFVRQNGFRDQDTFFRIGRGE